MSEGKAMWDRFFRGSKYEWKWKSGQLAKPVSSAELAAHTQRLAEDRKEEPPRPTTENPFGSTPDRKDVA